MQISERNSMCRQEPYPNEAVEWRALAKRAGDLTGTPCYLVSESIVRSQFSALRNLETSVSLRHWMSLKTQPIARIARTALQLGMGIDVASEYELHAALQVGYSPEKIVVNGVGKQHWLRKSRVEGLVVHFDSTAEVKGLAEVARRNGWTIGIRCAVPETSCAPNAPDAIEWGQFGMTIGEVEEAVKLLQDFEVSVRGLHFSLRTSVRSARDYLRAVKHISEIARVARISPTYIDIGGGLPVAGETTLEGVCAASSFNMNEYRDMLTGIPSMIPGVLEVWLENGRYLSGPAGALVITVLDKKEREDATYLICTGGRINNARVSAYEIHDILLSPERGGKPKKTYICGPTCAVVDRLGCWMISESIQVGDQIIWLNAGAYHVPLETRFSFGLAPVIWCDENLKLDVVRSRETPIEWWGKWI